MIDDIDDFPIFDPVGFEPGERENHNVGPGDVAAFRLRPHQEREVMAQRLDILRLALDKHDSFRLIDFGDWFAISDALSAARPLMLDGGQSAESFTQAGEDVTSLVAAFCLGQVTSDLRGHGLPGALASAYRELHRCDDRTAPAPDCFVDRVSQLVSDAAVSTGDPAFGDFRLGTASARNPTGADGDADDHEGQTFAELIDYVRHALAAVTLWQERL